MNSLQQTAPLPSAGTQPGEFCWNNLFRIKIRAENNPTWGGKSVTCFSISVEIFRKEKKWYLYFKCRNVNKLWQHTGFREASHCEQLRDIKGYDNILSKLMLRSEKQETREVGHRWHTAVENVFALRLGLFVTSFPWGLHIATVTCYSNPVLYPLYIFRIPQKYALQMNIRPWAGEMDDAGSAESQTMPEFVDWKRL